MKIGVRRTKKKKGLRTTMWQKEKSCCRGCISQVMSHHRAAAAIRSFAIASQRSRIYIKFTFLPPSLFLRTKYIDILVLTIIINEGNKNRKRIASNSGRSPISSLSSTIIAEGSKDSRIIILYVDFQKIFKQNFGNHFCALCSWQTLMNGCRNS